MKSKFSKTWNSSKQPRKQRKYIANAPHHLKRKLLGCALDKPLREKHNRRSIEVRKDDEVKIMRGKFSKKQGKVLIIDVKNSRVQIDGINRAKKDGEKAPVWFHPSNLKIIRLDDTDNRRMNKKAKATTATKETKPAESKKDAPIKKLADYKKVDTKETKEDNSKQTKPKEDKNAS